MGISSLVVLITFGAHINSFTIMKHIQKGLLPALMVSILIFSCSKETEIITPLETVAQQQFAEPMDDGPIYGSTAHRTLIKVRRHSNWYYLCILTGGPCLKTVVIKGDKLKHELEGTGPEIAAYFSGDEWEQHFTTDEINDEDFVNFMRSGDVAVEISGEGETGETYYLLGYDHLPKITTENASIIIPID